MGLILGSCKESEKDKITRLVNEWNEKLIVFPEDMVYTRYGKDTVTFNLPDSEFTVLFYIDSIGCTTCKLQSLRWTELMNEMDTLYNGKVSFQFVLRPMNRKELTSSLKRDKFVYPVLIDEHNQFNKMNNLPQEEAFHTFLLNKQNKVIAIGNPVSNPKIKELYFNIISGKTEKVDSSKLLTEIKINRKIINLGEFDWQEQQRYIFFIKNIGANLLSIDDIITSCGCLSVEYIRKPINPKDSLQIQMIYNSEKPEFFNKEIFLHGNFKDSPYTITLKGNSKDYTRLQVKGQAQ